MAQMPQARGRQRICDRAASEGGLREAGPPARAPVSTCHSVGFLHAGGHHKGRSLPAMTDVDRTSGARPGGISLGFVTARDRQQFDRTQALTDVTRLLSESLLRSKAPSSGWVFTGTLRLWLTNRARRSARTNDRHDGVG